MKERKPPIEEKQLRTALHDAILSGDLSRVYVCLETVESDELEAIDPETGKTPLTLAIKSSFCDAALALIERGAIPNRKDARGGLPFTYAVLENCVSVVSAILKHSSEQDWPNFAICFVQSPEMLDLIVSYGADVNEVDEDETPLFTMISEENCNSVLERLVYHGANINYRNEFQVTALMAEVTQNGPRNSEGCACLLDLGAEIIFPPEFTQAFADGLIEAMEEVGREDLAERARQKYAQHLMEISLNPPVVRETHIYKEPNPKPEANETSEFQERDPFDV